MLFQFLGISRLAQLLRIEVYLALFCFLAFQARKIEEHQRKYERKRAEREIKQRQKRVNRAREEHAKAAAGNQSQSMPNFGGAAPGGGKGDFKIPPELMDLFNDPEVQKCFEVSWCHEQFASSDS